MKATLNKCLLLRFSHWKPMSVSADGTKADYISLTVSWGLASLDCCPSNNKVYWCMIIHFTLNIF